MSRPPPPAELQDIVRRELATLGLHADRIESLAGDHTDWHVRIQFAGRRFELGSAHRDGFFCWESTDNHHRNFVPADCGPIHRAPDQLRREGLSMIRFALASPDFEGATYPVI